MQQHVSAMIDPYADQRYIDKARLAALILGGLGVLFGIAGLLWGIVLGGVFQLGQALLLFGFARGYARKNRTASVLCLVYHCIGVFVNWRSLYEPAAIAMFLIFGFFFARGTLAVYRLNAPNVGGNSST